MSDRRRLKEEESGLVAIQCHSSAIDFNFMQFCKKKYNKNDIFIKIHEFCRNLEISTEMLLAAMYAPRKNLEFLQAANYAPRTNLKKTQRRTIWRKFGGNFGNIGRNFGNSDGN